MPPAATKDQGQHLVHLHRQPLRSRMSQGRCCWRSKLPASGGMRVMAYFAARSLASARADQLHAFAAHGDEIVRHLAGIAVLRIVRLPSRR